MSVISFEEARGHVGHELECVIYGDHCVSVECIDCGEVIVCYERKESRKHNKRRVNGKNKCK